MTNIASSTVAIGNDILASHHNNLRTDIIGATYKEGVTAGEGIDTSSIPKAVYVNVSDGKYYLCDGTIRTKKQCIGFDITGANTSANGTINVQCSGVIRGLSGLTINAPYYLSTSGTITATNTYANTFIGIALSATTLLMFMQKTEPEIGFLIPYPAQYTSSQGHMMSDSYKRFVSQNTSTKTVDLVEFGAAQQSRVITSDWAAADNILGEIIIGAYLYVYLWDAGTTAYRVYRYNKTNLAAGGTQMTYASFGATAGSEMFSDGTYLYFTYQAGNSANGYSIRRLSINGTTLDSASNFSLSDTPTYYTVGANSTYIYWCDASKTLHLYNLSGTLQRTGSVSSASPSFMTFSDLDECYMTFDSSPDWAVRIPL